MHSRLAFAALLIASLTVGCAVSPTYTRPSVAIPDHFQGQAPVEHRTATGSADLAEWWAAFDDAQLAQLVKIALEQNLDLAQATARVTQARAAVGMANAALLPSAAVGAQAARAYQSVETPLGRVLNSNPNFDRYGSSYEANATAGWELDVFGGLRRGKEAALADYQASEAGAVAVRLVVAAQTADVYVSIRGLQTRLSIALRQVETQQDLLAKVKLLYGKGLAAELQVDQVVGELSQVRSSIPVLQAGLSTAMNALDVLLGAVPGTYSAALSTGGAIPAAPQIGVSGAPAELLRRRPDLIVAERRLAAANARIGVAITEYYPKFSLSGLVGSATSISGGNLFTGGASQYAGVLGLRWRLFDFGRINSQIEQAKGQEAELLASYRLAALKATEDVENAFANLVYREAQVAELTRAVDALTRSRAATFAAYEKGVVSLIEVLHADEKLLQASDARAQASAESARAAIASFKALGGGWQPTAHQVATSN
ncbi:RND transporter [Roseateles aquatilis]|uniref:RND transporter n=1 Tax=Roseateles aquatilis TaxID=431061 RepID=A0A246IY85_9BURK|nr:TolC family protein [Roseateles aquatilis]OWQ84769.1 RND transporter [Roseateles aquatilis]